MRRIKTEPNLSLQEYQERKALQAQQVGTELPQFSDRKANDTQSGISQSHCSIYLCRVIG